MQQGADLVVGAFRKCFLWDATMARPSPLPDYQALFPGYEAVVAEEYERLSSERSSPPREQGSRVPTSIGPYSLVRFLGRGGQGSVYVAVDSRDGSTVALKVFPGDAVNSERRLLRLRREAQAIAQLDHAGICRIHEAGLDGAVPYLALHYVPGRTLAEHIAQARHDAPGVLGSARAADRIGLPRCETGATPSRSAAMLGVALFFEKTARAVHAAHEAGLVHRDVKPSNLMVTPEGEPVVLDFGLVRAEDEGGTITATGALLGTPAYMAPEQLSNDGVRLDRRVDVYALGVSLFETLTLMHPFEAPTVGESIRESLTTKGKDLRDLDPEFPGDFAVVVATAMRRDRDRRYATALAFAEDLRAVREGRPIRARPPGPVQRLSDWARRNPAIAAASAVAFVTLTAGLGVSLRLLGAADSARAAATVTRGRADALLGLMVRDLTPRLDLLGRTDVLEPVALQAKIYFQDLPIESLSDEEIANLGVSLVTLCHLFENQGRINDASECCDRALSIRRDLVSRRPSDGRATRDLAESIAAVGRIASARGDHDGAIRSMREADALLSGITGPCAAERNARFIHASILRCLADEFLDAGVVGEAVAGGRRSVEIADAVQREYPADPRACYQAVESRRKLAQFVDAQGARTEAREILRGAIELARKIATARPDEPNAQLNLADCMFLRADQALARDDFAEALTSATEMRDVFRQLVLHDPFNARHKRILAQAHERVGLALAGRSDFKAAIVEYDAGAELLEELRKSPPGRILVLRDLASMHNQAGFALARAGNEEGALARFDKSRAILDQLIAEDPSKRSVQCAVASHRRQLGAILRDSAARRQYDQRMRTLAGETTDAAARERTETLAARAAEAIGEADAVTRTLVELPSHRAAWEYERALVLKELTEIRILRDDYAGAAAAAGEAIALRKSLAAKDPTYATRLGDLEDTLDYVQLLGGLRPPRKPSDRRALGIHFAMIGDPANALVHLREAVADASVRADLKHYALCQAARAAALEAGKASGPDGIGLRAEALALLRDELELRRNAVAALDERMASPSLAQADRTRLQKERADDVRHIDRLHAQDPAFTCLRGTPEFEGLFTAQVAPK